MEAVVVWKRSSGATERLRPATSLPGTRAVALAAALSLGCAAGSLPSLEGLLPASGTAALDEPTVVAGLKEALRVGTTNAVALTSGVDGFLANPRIRIPLPDSLEPMAHALRTVGLGGQVDQLELSMNRAAERAAGEAADVFWAAIRDMSVGDAWSILRGDETAATRYFRGATGPQLAERFRPIVAEKMGEVGLVRLYDDLASSYAALPFSKVRPPADIRQYVTDKALDGLFTMLADEERRIRTDPSARVSDLLQRVFGA